LIDGLKNQVIVEDETARQMFAFTPLGYEEAVRMALRRAKTVNKKTMRSYTPQKERRGCNVLHFLLFGSNRYLK
jgi:hypothetical protein